MKEITLPAAVESIAKVTELVDSELSAVSCPAKEQMQIDVAVDELFSNIAFYAYGDKTGDATVKVSTINARSDCAFFSCADNPHKSQSYKSSVEITFIDSGMPYNPLARADPDTTLSAEERNIGGLGVFIVKKTMDDVSYKYEDGKNILTIKKSWC